MNMKNNINEFQERSDLFESSLNSDFKQAHGIFYTDSKLSSDMIEFLEIPNDSSIIDPCCGSGSFILNAKQRGYQNIYGCDFDESTIEKCKELTSCPNLYCIDTLGNTGNTILDHIGHEKFDYVIGNPPYAPLSGDVTIASDREFLKTVSTSGNNLYVAALYRAFELAKEDGIISVIIPKSLLHVKAYAKLRKHILKNKTILSIVELGIRFKEVRGEQIILTLKNSKDHNNKICFHSYSNGEFKLLAVTPQDFYTNEVIVFVNNNEPDIYKKLINNYKTLDHYKVCTIARGKSKEDAIRGKQIRKYGFKDLELPISGTKIFIQNIYTAEAGITATFAGELNAGETVTVLTANDYDMAKYIIGILHSRICNYYLVRFAYNNSRLTMHADGKYLYTIPFVISKEHQAELKDCVAMLEKCEYLSSEWFSLNDKLNAIVYKIYDFTDTEKLYIETEMRSISSSKWYLDGQAKTVYY